MGKVYISNTQLLGVRRRKDWVIRITRDIYPDGYRDDLEAQQQVEEAQGQPEHKDEEPLEPQSEISAQSQEPSARAHMNDEPRGLTHYSSL